jgi:putative ABC transport system permease protein
MLGLLDNALVQGLAYGIAVLGVMVAFRIVRFPDLTADGSFLLGACGMASSLAGGLHWSIGLVLGASFGAAAGAITSALHFIVRVPRLLAGILTSMMAYSVSYRLLGNRSNLGLLDAHTMFSRAEELDRVGSWFDLQVRPGTLLVSAAATFAATGLVVWLARSEVGLLLRSSGDNPHLLEDLGWRPDRWQTLGLVAANALVGAAGALVAARQGFADVNMSIGLILVLIAALVLGEEAARMVGLEPARSLSVRAIAPLAGAVLYFLFYLTLLRASVRGWLPFSVQPTDLKLLAALVVVGAFAVRAAKGRTHDEPVPN